MTEELINVLENGLSYYIIRENQIRKNIQLKLVVKVGSLIERPNEKGMAHFIEHMGLSYDKYHEYIEILSNNNKINPHKFVFKGYTDFDHTIFELNSDLSDYRTLDEGLLLLSKIINGEIFKEEVFEKVKKDIIEEYDNNYKKTNKQKEIISFITQNTIQELPIGNRDIINQFSYEQMLQFYKDRYSLFDMAIIIAGDLNVKVVEGNVKKVFGNWKDNMKKGGNTNAKLIQNGSCETLVLGESLDKNCTLQYYLFYSYNSRFNHVNELILKDIFVIGIIEYITRVSKINKKKFQNIIYGEKRIATDFGFFTFSFRSKNSYDCSLVKTSLSRLRKVGFYNVDVQMAKKKYLKALKLRNNRNNEMIYEFIGAFLYNESILINQEYKKLSEICEHISLEDINEYMRFVLSGNCNIIIDCI